MGWWRGPQNYLVTNPTNKIPPAAISTQANTVRFPELSVRENPDVKSLKSIPEPSLEDERSVNGARRPAVESEEEPAVVLDPTAVNGSDGEIPSAAATLFAHAVGLLPAEAGA